MFRTELDAHITAASAKGRSAGWSLKLDRVAKTLTVSNKNGRVARITATGAILKMNPDDLVGEFLGDTITEVRKRRQV